MRWDLVLLVVGLLCYAGGLHLIGGILIIAAIIKAIRD